MFRTPFGNWTCAVCITSFSQNTASASIEGTQVCPNCIRRIFSLAIERETNFPPRWGRSILHPESFSHILDAGFIRTYNTKAAEWRLAVDQRVYCQHRRGAQGACSRFLGAREQRTVCRRCGDCTGFTCMRCLKSFGSRAGSGNEIQISHECNTQAEERSRQQAFSGLQKGRHYQDCPRCKRRIELRDGCNAISCLCGASFCYYCGGEATESSNHWGMGRCPRWRANPLPRNALGAPLPAARRPGSHMLFGAAAAPAQALPNTIAPVLRTPTVTTPARGTAVAARGAHTAGTARGATVTRNANPARPAAAAPVPAIRPARGANAAQQNAGMAALNRQFGMLGTSGFQPNTPANSTNQASPQTSQSRGQFSHAARGRGAPVGRQGRPHLRGGWLPVQGPEDRTGLADRRTGSDSMLAEQLQNQELGFNHGESEVEQIEGSDRGMHSRRSNTRERESTHLGNQLRRSRSPLFRRGRAPRDFEQQARRRSYTPPPVQHTPMFSTGLAGTRQQAQQSSDFSHDEINGPWGAQDGQTARYSVRPQRGRQRPPPSSDTHERDIPQRNRGTTGATSPYRSPHDGSRSMDSAATASSSRSSSTASETQRRWSWDSGAGSSRPPLSRRSQTSRRRPRPGDRYRGVRDAFSATLRGLADLIS